MIVDVDGLGRSFHMYVNGVVNYFFSLGTILSVRNLPLGSSLTAYKVQYGAAGVRNISVRTFQPQQLSGALIT